MTTSERADVTNGIWLCRNCHGTVDRDEAIYPAELLFEWRRGHEKEIRKRLGRRGAAMRDKISEDKLRAFSSTSYLAQQIVIDKPAHWEYKLTAEILRDDLEVIQIRWLDLQNGLYLRRSTYITYEETFRWLSIKLDEAIKIVSALQKLISVEMQKAWGAAGKPGDENAILRVCKLIAGAAERLLEWEEDMQFTYFPDQFGEAKDFLQGSAGAQIKELLRIPSEFAKLFELENPTGTQEIKLVFSLPEDFGDRFDQIMKRCHALYLQTSFLEVRKSEF